MLANRERERERRGAAGIPIGNLTSQLFANIYLNEFDYFIKHGLKIKHYIRYTDDFIIVADNTEYFQALLHPINNFLKNTLRLELHPRKITIRKFRQGIDFLGYVIFPKYRLVRTKTKRRIFKKMKKRVQEYHRGEISKDTLEGSISSYLGVLSHANCYVLSKEIKDMIKNDL